MLTDTGPLLALLDQDDPHHAACVVVARRLTAGPLMTTWPCFTEAMYLLGEVGGFQYQERLWSMHSTGKLELLTISAEEADRMRLLMEKYQDTPMDLADASLVAITEGRALKRVWVLESDFYIYRLSDGSALEVVR